MGCQSCPPQEWYCWGPQGQWWYSNNRLISIYYNSVSNNRPQNKVLGNKPHKFCIYSPEPLTEVLLFEAEFLCIEIGQLPAFCWVKYTTGLTHILYWNKLIGKKLLINILVLNILHIVSYHWGIWSCCWYFKESVLCEYVWVIMQLSVCNLEESLSINMKNNSPRVKNIILPIFQW